MTLFTSHILVYAYPSICVKIRVYFILAVLLYFMNIHTIIREFKWKALKTISRWPLYVHSVYSTVCFDEMGRLYWLCFSHHNGIIAKHPTEKEKEKEQPICAFITWLFEATVQTKQGLCLRHLWGPVSLSIHFFIGFRWFPPSPPLRGPHLITDHHSHLACVPFQLSAQFLSDDPREPQAHWPRLESPNRSLSHPSRFCAPDTDPLPAQSDPEWKAHASVACYMTCDIRLTQWHKRMPGSATHPTMALVCCLFSTILCLSAIVQFYRLN